MNFSGLKLSVVHVSGQGLETERPSVQNHIPAGVITYSANLSCKPKDRGNGLTMFPISNIFRVS
jgi:hypothetical protein